MKHLPLNQIKITSPFGMRMHPIQKVMKLHNGVDLVAAVGAQVFAYDNGTVILSKFVAGAGECVVIKHSDCYSYYCHLSKRNVGVGQILPSGFVLGLSGNTGDSTGPHLHFGLAKTFNLSNFSKSDWYDPEPALKEIINGVPKQVEVLYLGLLFKVNCINKNNENYIRLKDLEDVLHLCGIGWFNNKVTINGKYIDLNRYSTINYSGENYIRLRDIETIGLAKISYNGKPVITP